MSVLQSSRHQITLPRGERAASDARQRAIIERMRQWSDDSLAEAPVWSVVQGGEWSHNAHHHRLECSSGSGIGILRLDDSYAAEPDEMDVELLIGSEGLSGGGYIGPAWGILNENNYWYINFDARELRKVEGGTETVVRSSLPWGAVPTRWRLQVRGDRLTVTADGSAYLDDHFEGVPVDHVGVRTYRAGSGIVWIDHVSARYSSRPITIDPRAETIWLAHREALGMASIYDDDFSGTTAYTIQSGTWTHSPTPNEFLRCWGSGVVSLDTPGVLTDTDVTMTLQLESGQYIGPAWRIQSGDTMYFVHTLDRQIRKLVGGGASILVAGGGDEVDQSVPFSVRVRHIGSDITVWINDELWLEGYDDEIGEGLVGARAWGSGTIDARFHDIDVVAHQYREVAINAFSRWSLYLKSVGSASVRMELSPGDDEWFEVPDGAIDLVAGAPKIVEIGYDAERVRIASDSDDALITAIIRGVY